MGARCEHGWWGWASSSKGALRGRLQPRGASPAVSSKWYKWASSTARIRTAPHFVIRMRFVLGPGGRVLRTAPCGRRGICLRDRAVMPPAGARCGACSQCRRPRVFSGGSAVAHVHTPDNTQWYAGRSRLQRRASRMATHQFASVALGTPGEGCSVCGSQIAPARGMLPGRHFFFL